MTTTFMKLRSGEWGLRGPATMVAGTTVRVAKKNGAVTTATVGKIISRGKDYAIATIARENNRRRSRGDDADQRLIDRMYGRRLTPEDGWDYYTSGQYDLDS